VTACFPAEIFRVLRQYLWFMVVKMARELVFPDSWKRSSFFPPPHQLIFIMIRRSHGNTIIDPHSEDLR
jgi:ABC-type ATPase with predicted acetyltransferase domain